MTAPSITSMPGAGLSLPKRIAASTSDAAALPISLMRLRDVLLAPRIRFSNRLIGSRAIQESYSSFGRGSRMLTRKLCWPQR